MSAAVRVLLVDDQPLARAGLRRILEQEEPISIVGECDDGDQVVAAVERHQPDVVVMDVRMRRVDGARATALLAARPNAPRVLILTTFGDDETVAAALRSGAAGFLLKDAPAEDIVRAVTFVADGGSWLDPQITANVLAMLRRATSHEGGDRADIGLLTQRELDVLAAVGRGATNAEIAEALSIGETTVKSHLGHLLTKLDLRDRAAAIVLAHRHHLS
jgi:DNA-binding NarL/FixJ family response regulator